MESLDGIVAFESDDPPGFVISGGSDADRFLMGLLRALADAVLIGAGTLREEPLHLWIPERIYKPGADAYAALRASLGKSPRPQLVVVSASGALNLDAAALREGALVITTEAGADRLAGKLPPASSVRVLGTGRGVDVRDVVASLRADGFESILSEGGPHLFGDLVAAGLVNELFLTLSPVLSGRSEKHFGLIEGVQLLPQVRAGAELLSARRHGSHLFLRYGLRRSS